MQPQELKQAILSGLLSFPITDFGVDNQFNPASYRQRLEWLMPYGASALFAAGGTGEFFSLAQEEYSAVVRTALATCKGRVPIIAGAGYGTATAIGYAREAERLGAQGLLLLPHYLTEASQEGLYQHVSAVCAATRLGVIVYNRGACRLAADTVARLAERCANLVGFKDGIGDIELMVSIRRRMGDRLAYLGGLPTAEIFAQAYRAMGVPVYSSAVFNFIPKTAMDFYRALACDDHATCNRILDNFFMPFLRIRNRGAGYAVSTIKAGARLVGHDGGRVRTPLTELTADETDELAALIKAQGPQ
jgi:5-dehydro-4-deoxyglucarate dehydratase